MKKKKLVKPAMLYAAEEIYLEISQIKLKNPEISLIESLERYIGSESYENLCSGQFHNQLLSKLKKDQILIGVLNPFLNKNKLLLNV